MLRTPGSDPNHLLHRKPLGLSFKDTLKVHVALGGGFVGGNKDKHRKLIAR